MWETEKYCQDSPAQGGGKWQSVAPGRAGWPSICTGGLVITGGNVAPTEEHEADHVDEEQNP
jgi:hypothetical protein